MFFCILNERLAKQINQTQLLYAFNFLSHYVIACRVHFFSSIYIADFHNPMWQCDMPSWSDEVRDELK